MSTRVKWAVLRVLFAAGAIFSALYALGMASTQADEPRWDQDRRARVDRDVEALHDRLAHPRDYMGEAQAREESERLRLVEREASREREVEALVASMRALLHARIPSSTPALAAAEAERRDVAGLARALVGWADARSRSGGWLPLSREKAPAFLAAVAFHESSWRWRNTHLRGSRGERCAMQVLPQVLDLGHFDQTKVSRDVGTCLEASTWLMERCARMCGEVPAERWFGCYASGRCGTAGGVVDERFATARFLLGDH